MSKNILYNATLLRQTILDKNYVDVKSDCRKRATVYYRMAYVALLREKYGISYKQLARLVEKNHASCIYFVKQSKYLLSSPYGDYKEVFEIVVNLERKVNSSVFILPRMYGPKVTKKLKARPSKFPSVS